MGDCPKEYLEFNDREAEMVKEYETGKASDGLVHKQTYPAFEDFAKDWEGMSERDPEKGVYGYWDNPNAKWDWFVMGGRWAGQLKLRPGKTGVVGEKIYSTPEIAAGHVDQAIKGDLDLTEASTTFSLLKDGVWYQRGEMGWWGVVSDRKPDEEWTGQWVELVLNLPDETLLTVVDCHI